MLLAVYRLYIWACIVRGAGGTCSSTCCHAAESHVYIGVLGIIKHLASSATIYNTAHAPHAFSIMFVNTNAAFCIVTRMGHKPNGVTLKCLNNYCYLQPFTHGLQNCVNLSGIFCIARQKLTIRKVAAIHITAPRGRWHFVFYYTFISCVLLPTNL
jgi:hypothetical protein